MDLRQLRMFVAVARELNFRRAAEHVHVAQPVLSRRIRQLEDELGVQLLTRTKRRVDLTPSGRLFLEAVTASLARLDQGVREVRRAEGVQDTLSVGFVEYANFPFVPTVFKRFTALRPDVRLEQRELTPGQQLELLSSGELDVSFIGLPAVVEKEGLAFVPVHRTRWKLAMSSEHPLAEKREVSIESLRGEKLILFPRFINPNLYDWIRRCFASVSIEPRIVQEPAQLHTAISLVAAGVGVMPSPFFLGGSLLTDVRLKPLKGFGPGAQISAAYRRKDASGALTDFLGVVRDVARSSGEA